MKRTKITKRIKTKEPSYFFSRSFRGSKRQSVRTDVHALENLLANRQEADEPTTIFSI